MNETSNTAFKNEEVNEGESVVFKDEEVNESESVVFKDEEVNERNDGILEKEELNVTDNADEDGCISENGDKRSSVVTIDDKNPYCYIDTPS